MDEIQEDTYAMDPALFFTDEFPPDPKPGDVGFL
jgi:hypothetical protein